VIRIEDAELYRTLAKCVTVLLVVAMFFGCVQIYVGAQVEMETRRMALRLAEIEKKACRPSAQALRSPVLRESL
jgi:hypothetical protein